MTTKEIIDEALSLPVDQRALIADSMLRSLNAPDPDVDRLWAREAIRRRDALRSGTAAPVSGSTVFARIRERYTP